MEGSSKRMLVAWPSLLCKRHFRNVTWIQHASYYHEPQCWQRRCGFLLCKKVFQLVEFVLWRNVRTLSFYFDNGESIRWCFHSYKRKKVVWVLDNWNVGTREDYLIHLENLACSFLEHSKFYRTHIDRQKLRTTHQTSPWFPPPGDQERLHMPEQCRVWCSRNIFCVWRMPLSPRGTSSEFSPRHLLHISPWCSSPQTPGVTRTFSSDTLRLLESRPCCVSDCHLRYKKEGGKITTMYSLFKNFINGDSITDKKILAPKPFCINFYMITNSEVNFFQSTHESDKAICLIIRFRFKQK